MDVACLTTQKILSFLKICGSLISRQSIYLHGIRICTWSRGLESSQRKMRSSRAFFLDFFIVTPMCFETCCFFLPFFYGGRNGIHIQNSRTESRFDSPHVVLYVSIVIKINVVRRSISPASSLTSFTTDSSSEVHGSL